MRDSTEWTEDKSTNHAFINHYGSYEALVNMKSNKHLENPTEKGQRQGTKRVQWGKNKLFVPKSGDQIKFEWYINLFRF